MASRKGKAKPALNSQKFYQRGAQKGRVLFFKIVVQKMKFNPIEPIQLEKVEMKDKRFF